MRRIVPKKPAPMPDVCGTGNSFVERSYNLAAMVEALAITARATAAGLELVITADAEVEGIPRPWALWFSVPNGPPSYVTVDDAPETRVQMPGAAVSGDSVELSVRQGDVMSTKTIAVTR